MAETAALTSIAKSALQLFTSLAKDEFLLLWHSSEDLQKLRRTIEFISCSLQDAEKRKSNEHLVQCWLSDLRKVMYDAEDLFDALAAHVLSKKTMSGNAFTKEVRLFFSRSNQLGFIVKTAHEVKSIRESLDGISKNMQQFNFIPQQPLPLDQPVARKKTHSFVLEALRPHEKLEYLSIKNYGGEMLSSWFWTLRYVKQLHLSECHNVEYLEDGIKGNLDLPSLQLLEISSMRNLKGWRRQEMAQGTSRLHLSNVLSLSISWCPKLKGQEMPLFGAIEDLSLCGVDAEVVEELLVSNSSSQSSFSPFHNNSKLKELELQGIQRLTQLPEGWISHLTALQKLTIEGCRDLKRVSRRGLSHLTALKHLMVESGEIGTDEDDKIGSEAGMPWKALQGLEYLDIGVGDINLVEGLQYLTSLRQLQIKKWKDVGMSPFDCTLHFN